MGALTDYVTTTRNLVGYARDNAGVLTEFPVNTARRTDRGFLVEGERTNYCPESTTIGVVSGLNTWQNTNVTVTTGQPAPDGTNTAILVTDNTVDGLHSIARQNLLGSPTGQVTCSIWAKAGTLEYFIIRYGNVSVLFDLMRGRWDRWLYSNTAGIFYTAYIEEFADGWYRCASVVDAAGLPTFFLTNNGNFRTSGGVLSSAPSYDGDGTGTLYLWGPMIEQTNGLDTYPSSYIKNVGKVTTTRPKDVPTLIGGANTIVNVANTTGASIVVEALLNDGTTNAKFICSADGTPNLLGSSGHRKAISNVATTATSGTSLTGADYTTGMKVGCSWNASGRTVVAGLGTIATAPNEAFTAEARTIGDGTLFGYIKSIRLWNSRIDNSYLQSYTTFNEPAPETADESEDHYFSLPADEASLLSPHDLVWTVGGGNSWAYNGVFHTAAWTPDRTRNSDLPSGWNLGLAPRFFNASLGAETVSIGAAAAAPDGTTNAKKIVESAALSEHYLQSGLNGTDSMNVEAGVRYRYTSFLKRDERTRAVLVAQDIEYIGSTRSGINGVKALFDLHGGTVVSAAGFGEWTDYFIGADITPWGDGWFRCSLKFRYPYMGSLVTYKQYMKCGVLLDAGCGSGPEKTYYAGDGTSGLYMWRSNLFPMAADEQITAVLMRDDFNSIATIDRNDTRLPGYNWYPHRTWPTLADSPKYTDDGSAPVMPELLQVSNSEFRYPDRSDAPEHYHDNTPGVFSACWAGNSVDAYATGAMLATPATPWEECREMYIGHAYKVPIFSACRLHWQLHAPIDIAAGWWAQDMRAYLCPRLNPDGTPVQLLFPCAMPQHSEINPREEGFGQSFNDWRTDQTTGVQSVGPGRKQVLEQTMPDNTVYQTYAFIMVNDSIPDNDYAMTWAIAGGIFTEGWSTTAQGVGSNGRDFTNGEWMVWLIVNGHTGVVDWALLYGDPVESVSVGLATGPT